jgi:signal transduction histidine kinase
MVAVRLHGALLLGAGLVIWALVGWPTTSELASEPAHLATGENSTWLVCYAAFGLAWTVARWPRARPLSPAAGRAALAVQAATAVGMVAAIPCYMTGVCGALVAWQAGLELRLREAAVWVAAASGAMGWLFLKAGYAGAWPDAVSLVLFQALTLCTATLLRREAKRRAELARLNEELRRAREELAEASRRAERLRISRELHDLLGHGLAALHLQLEVAHHRGSGDASEPIERARGVAGELLDDVRRAVSLFRSDDTLEVRSAVARLADGLPEPRVHLAAPDGLRADDPLQAHTIVRCIQELLTNVVRHAGARNVWVELSKTPEALEATVRDDGRGAAALVEGNGLTGMRERLVSLGGQLVVESRAGDGFRADLRVPRSGDAA